MKSKGASRKEKLISHTRYTTWLMDIKVWLGDEDKGVSRKDIRFEFQ